jgi:hypothetical protein
MINNKRKISALVHSMPSAKKNTLERNRKIKMITSAHDIDTSDLENYVQYLPLSFLDKLKKLISKNSDNLAIIHVSSFSQDKKYNVYLQKNKNNMYFLCDCGEQFRAGKRKKCKHIKFILSSILQKYTKCKNPHDIKNGTDLMFYMDKLSIDTTKNTKNTKNTQNILSLFINESVVSLLFDSDLKYYFKCNCSLDEFACIHIKTIIASFYQSYINAYIRNCKKKKELTNSLKCRICL